MRLPPVLVAGLAAATSLIAAAPASALVTTYEAENFTSTITSGSWTPGRAGAASGLRYVQLNSGGSITFAVPTRVRAFYAIVKSQSCADGKGGSAATYAYEGHPSYWQEDPYFTEWTGTVPPPAGPTFAGGAGAGFAKITSPPRGWSPPSIYFNDDPSFITVKFNNDYKGPSCDRNLQVDALKVVS